LLEPVITTKPCSPLLLQVVVFDGDSFADSSFTRLLPLIAEALPSVELVAYLRECDQERFNRDWHGHMPPCGIR